MTLEEYLIPGREYLWVSFSRSGDSPEGVQVVERALEQLPNVRHLVVSCNPESRVVRTIDGKPNSFGHQPRGSSHRYLLKSLGLDAYQKYRPTSIQRWLRCFVSTAPQQSCRYMTRSVKYSHRRRADAGLAELKVRRLMSVTAASNVSASFV
jgi:hypothetical protein